MGARVVLSKLPAVTHVADVDRGTVDLQFTQKSRGSIGTTMLDNPAVALPGHYYLFLMTDNGKGPTPSRAAIVKIVEMDRSNASQPFGV